MWANNLRAFAVFAVILLHVAAEFISGIPLDDASYGNHTWWAADFYESITRWCVPLFIMISGYFLLNKQEPNDVFFKKRVKRILLPVIFWSLAFSAWIFIKAYAKGEAAEAPLTITQNWLAGSPYYHLWYLFMLPFLYLITPLLKVIQNALKRCEYFAFMCFCFALAMLSALVDSLLLHWQMNAQFQLFTNGFLNYIGYFALGGYLAKYEVKPNTKVCLFGLIVAFIITMLGSYWFTYDYFYSYLSINTVMASICLFLLIQTYADHDLRLKTIAGLSFGIYLIHPLFIDIISFAVKDKLLAKIDVLIYIPLSAMTVFILSSITVWVMSKIILLRNCV